MWRSSVGESWMKSSSIVQDVGVGADVVDQAAVDGNDEKDTRYRSVSAPAAKWSYWMDS